MSPWDLLSPEVVAGTVIGYRRGRLKGAAIGGGAGLVLKMTLDPSGRLIDLARGLVAESSASTAGPSDPSQPGERDGLRKGAKGEAVRQLQTWLNEATAAGLVVDGDFGAGTDAALRAFQKAQGLPVTGIADDATLLPLRRLADSRRVTYTSDVTDEVAENANIPPALR